MKTDKNYLQSMSLMALAWQKEHREHKEIALKNLKEIITNERRIELAKYGEDVCGERIPLDYEGTVNSYGARSWETGDRNSNIVALFEDNDTTYGEVVDGDRFVYTYPLDDLDFDPVEALMAVVLAVMGDTNGPEK